LTAFSVPIPQALKRSLTTVQIIQFLVGAFYAALHSFVSYTIPVQVPDLTTSVENAVSTATTAVSSVAAAASSPGLANPLKKFLFRAAGEERLAENVNGGYSGEHKFSGVRYHPEYQTIQCVNTSGQTFAIWFNVFYLTPLTVLFVRFFVKSYLRRSQKGGHSTKHRAAEKAGKDALKGVEREIYGNGNENGYANGHANNGHANGKASGKH
jgi:hypothetical protein